MVERPSYLYNLDEEVLFFFSFFFLSDGHWRVARRRRHQRPFPRQKRIIDFTFLPYKTHPCAALLIIASALFINIHGGQWALRI